MSRSKTLTLHLDMRWYEALKEQLDGVSVEDEMNRLLGDRLKALPEQTVREIEQEIREEELRRTDIPVSQNVFHMTDFPEELYFRADGAEDFLTVADALRRCGRGNFEKCFPDRMEIGEDEFRSCAAARMTGEGNCFVYEIDWDRGTFGSVEAVRGMVTCRMEDVCAAAAFAMRCEYVGWSGRRGKFLDYLSQKKQWETPVVPLFEEELSPSDEMKFS